MRNMILGLACALVAAGSQAEPIAVCREPNARTQTLDGGQQKMFKYAVQLFSNGRFAAAYGRLAKLADAGHLPSAQLALVMYRQGPLVFASEWDATEQQLDRWSVLVGCDALGATGHAATVRPAF